MSGPRAACGASRHCPGFQTRCHCKAYHIGWMEILRDFPCSNYAVIAINPLLSKSAACMQDAAITPTSKAIDICLHNVNGFAYIACSIAGPGSAARRPNRLYSRRRFLLPDAVLFLRLCRLNPFRIRWRRAIHCF